MDTNKLPVTEAPQYDHDKEKGDGIETVDVGPWAGHPGVHRTEDVVQANSLARKLQGRHMQMIAIGTIYSVALQRRSLLLTWNKVALSVLVCLSALARLCTKVDQEAWYAVF